MFLFEPLSLLALRKIAFESSTRGHYTKDTRKINFISGKSFPKYISDSTLPRYLAFCKTCILKSFTVHIWGKILSFGNDMKY